MKLSNGLWQYREFNSRLQATEIRLWNGSTNLLAFNYGYGSANNSGNVLSQQIAMPGLSLTQNYAYDTLNRLETASETGSWSQTYGCDRFGIRWVASGAEYGNEPALTPTLQSNFDAATNRLEEASYDMAGNLMEDALGRTFDYDTENRQVAFQGGMVEYFYDGEGRRVKKASGAEVTVYVYNILGQLVAEYCTTGNPELGDKYLTADHLCSTRVITSQDGQVDNRYDYLPFGEEVAAVHGDRSTVAGYSSFATLNHKFTRKERDVESGLDYVGARYLNVSRGRFTTIDSVAVSTEKILDSQQLNLYGYTRNNPLKYIDPIGEVLRLADLGEEERKQLIEILKKRTGLQLQYSERTGNLMIRRKGEGGSPTLRSDLIAVVEHERVFNVLDQGEYEYRGRTQRIDFGAYDPDKRNIILDFKDFSIVPDIDLRIVFYHKAIGHGLKGLRDQPGLAFWRATALSVTAQVGKELNIPYPTRSSLIDRGDDRHYIRVAQPLAPPGTWKRFRQVWLGIHLHRLVDVTDVVRQK